MNKKKHIPKLIVFTGLLGTGKSKQATKLAKKYNYRILQIDSLRDIMIPHPQYNSREMFDMYRVMISITETLLNLGYNVILDATFSQRKYHSLLKNLVENIKPHLLIIYCYCSEEESVKRLKRRIQKGKDIAKDTNPARYHEHKKTFHLIDFYPIFKVCTEDEKNSTFRKIEKYINENQLYKKN